jgi:hypothetical protein
MANGPDFAAVNNDMTLGLRAMSMTTISTLLSSCTLLAALAIMNGNKAADIFNTGVPDSTSILSGSEISPAKQKEIMECDQYNPLERALYQSNLKIMSLRDTNPKMSTGSGATITLTSAATLNYGIATATIAASATDFAGAVPDLRVNDKYGGQGAVLRAVVTGGSVSSVTIVSPGYGYNNASSTSYTTVQVLTNKSAGEKYQRPAFRWTQMKSQGRIYEHDHDRARALANGNEDYFNQKINDIYTDDSKELVALQIKRMQEDCIFGTPDNATAAGLTAGQGLWSSPYGLTYMIDDSSVYAGVDRSLAANAYWCSVVDSSAHVFSLVDIWQDATVTKGRINNGGTIDAIFVSGTLFNKWQRESLAYSMNINNDPAAQMLKATFGYKRLPLLFNGTYVFLEPLLPPKTVFCLNMKPIILAFKQGKKWSISGPYPQEGVDGGIDGSIYYVNTQYMLINEAPNFGSVQYTNVS